MYTLYIKLRSEINLCAAETAARVAVVTGALNLSDGKPGRHTAQLQSSGACAESVDVLPKKRTCSPSKYVSINKGGVEVKYFLVSLPVVGVLLGATVFNRVTPFVLGMPVFFAWTLFNVFMMSAIMLVIYRMDPVNARSRKEIR